MVIFYLISILLLIFYIFFKVQGKLKQLNCNVIDRNVSLELIIIHRFFIYMLYIFFISDSS